MTLDELKQNLHEILDRQARYRDAIYLTPSQRPAAPDYMGDYERGWRLLCDYIGDDEVREMIEYLRDSIPQRYWG